MRAITTVKWLCDSIPGCCRFSPISFRSREASKMRFVITLAVFAGLVNAGEPAAHGTYQRIKVHGKSLEGNLSGEPVDRDVSIYLPPSYQKEANRRYPVVYLLHGY